MAIRSEPVVYGSYQIKTFKALGTWKAQAWRRDSKASDVVTADSYEDAVLAVKAQIDRWTSEQHALRGPDGYPTVAEVRAAFDAIKMTDGQSKMLIAHLAATDHILTATQLAEAASYKDYSAANIHYGGLGKLLSEELNWLPQERRHDEPVWTFTLATDAEEAARLNKHYEIREFRWRLRPQVVEALS